VVRNTSIYGAGRLRKKFCFCMTAILDYTCRMLGSRRQKERQAHYCLLVNKSATRYTAAAVTRLTDRIRAEGKYFSVLEPETALAMAEEAEKVAGLAPGGQKALPQFISRRGKVTALVAAGGDGTFNLVARAAAKAGLPVGIFPLGRYNNIAQSILGSVEAERATQAIISRKYAKVDYAMAAGLPLFGSLGLGFVPELAKSLENRKLPRLAWGWNQLGTKVAEEVERRQYTIQLDSYRFEVSSRLVMVNLQPRTLGIGFSPVSLTDDGQMEVQFDVIDSPKVLGNYLRLTARNGYLYRSEIRQFRGRQLTISPVQDQWLYLDGELLQLPTNILEVRFANEQLRVFC
jgi:diacylglycerol kinase (ATP)